MYKIRKQDENGYKWLYKRTDGQAGWTRTERLATKYNAADAKFCVDLLDACAVSTDGRCVDDSGMPDTIDLSCHR